MINLSKRESEIILYICSKPMCKAKDIATIFNKSEKTIRNDIKSINSIFNVPLILSTNQGFQINDLYEDKLANMTLSNNSINDISLILFTLLTNQEYRYEEFLDILYMSETTFFNRMKDVKELVKKFGLALNKKNNVFYITGSNLNRRNLYIYLMINEVGENFNDLSKYQQYFDNIDIIELIEYFKMLLNEYGYCISDFYFNNLLLNLFIIINFDYYFTLEDSFIKQNDMIREIALKINEKFNMTSNDKTDEIYGCLVGTLNRHYDYSTISPSFNDDINNIICEVFSQYKLEIDTAHFLDLLSLHLYNMILRCKNNCSINSSDNLYIKESCFFIYDIAVTIARKLSLIYQIEINQNEIALISMHIGFAIEDAIKNDIHSNILKIVIDTSSYTQNFTFLEKLKQIVKIEAAYTFIKDIDVQKELMNYDLLISTNHNFYANIAIKRCNVSPILSHSDQHRIEHAILTIARVKKLQKIKSLFSLFFNEKFFYISSKLDDKHQVIKYMVDQLHDHNIVNDDFMQSVLLRESIASTDISKMYAIPHAMDFIANKTMMSVYINREGIRWGSSDIKIVFLCAINNNNINNLRIIYDFIIEKVSDTSCYSKLVQAKNIDEFSNVLFEEINRSH